MHREVRTAQKKTLLFSEHQEGGKGGVASNVKRAARKVFLQSVELAEMKIKGGHPGKNVEG